MDWQTFIDLLVQGGAITVFISAVGGGLYWVTKKLVGFHLNKKISSHTAKLEKKNLEAVEKLKHDLQLVALEHQVRYTRLHEKRADIISKLYKNICVITNDIAKYAAVFDIEVAIQADRIPISKGKIDGKMSISEMEEVIVKLGEFYSENKIYFSENLCDFMESFLEITYAIPSMFIHEKLVLGAEQDEFNEIVNTIKAFKMVSDEVLHSIETEFRSLLGVD